MDYQFTLLVSVKYRNHKKSDWLLFIAMRSVKSGLCIRLFLRTTRCYETYACMCVRGKKRYVCLKIDDLSSAKSWNMWTPGGFKIFSSPQGWYHYNSYLGHFNVLVLISTDVSCSKFVFKNLIFKRIVCVIVMYEWEILIMSHNYLENNYCFLVFFPTNLSLLKENIQVTDLLVMIQCSVQFFAFKISCSLTSVCGAIYWR